MIALGAAAGAGESVAAGSIPTWVAVLGALLGLVALPAWKQFVKPYLLTAEQKQDRADRAAKQEQARADRAADRLIELQSGHVDGLRDERDAAIKKYEAELTSRIKAEGRAETVTNELAKHRRQFDEIQQDALRCREDYERLMQRFSDLEQQLATTERPTT